MGVVDEKVIESSFFKQLSDRYEKGDVDALSKWRRLGWEQLIAAGLPTRKREEYRYVRLRKMWAKEWNPAGIEEVCAETIRPHLLPECEKASVVLVNGAFRPDLSNTDKVPDLTLLPLSEATKKYRSFLQGRLRQESSIEKDPFALANHALHGEGVFLYLPPEKTISSPIQILHVVTQADGAQFFPRVHCFVGGHAQLSLIRTQVSLSDGEPFVSSLLDFAVDDGAKVTLHEQDSERTGYWFDAIRATCKRDSRFKSTVVTGGSTISRRDYRVALVGEGCDVDLSNLWLLSGDREAHSHVLIDHQAPHCTSTQLFKGVLTDLSRSSFEGKIFVRQAAQKTDAYQMNKHLLLSDNAHADSKPNLEIFADDVKASHGSTVGQLDCEQLHYLRTRGCSKEEAEHLLVKGFAREVIEKIEWEAERSKAEALMRRGLK